MTEVEVDAVKTEKKNKGKPDGQKGKKRDNNKANKIPFPHVKHREEGKWYEYQVEGKIENPAKDTLPADEYDKMFNEASVLLRTDADLYNRLMRTQGGSEAAWLQTVIHKGTSGDKMTAMQLQIRKSPIHAISILRSMVQQTTKKHAREAMDNMPILETLFVEELIPLNRKLISFNQRPLRRLNEVSSGMEKRTLVLWMFEHELKEIYNEFCSGLEVLSGGATESVSLRALKITANLLAERPEGEQRLLTLLVNKLGHPNYKVGARVAVLLESLSRKQPNMRPIIVSEVERLIYRKHVNERAHLYASTFLSQMALRAGEADLAVSLLSIYFGLFKTLIAKRKADHRLLKILLTAANRAFPYAKEKAESLIDDINALYKLVHSASFAVSLQTLKLLFQVLNLSDSISDRFYTALYRKLFDHIPPNMYNQMLLLLFKTLKADTVEHRVRSMVKRLLQLAVNEAPPFAAGILILVSRLREERPALVVTKKQADLIAAHSNPVNGVIDDEEEEIYMDMDDEGKPIQRVKDDPTIDETNSDDELSTKKKDIKGKVAPSKIKGWVHKQNLSHHGGVSLYDASARNPVFVDCSQTIDAELRMLAIHYHPSIAVFANSLIRGENIRYNGDPLEDFTTIKFLDRFVYRNPKDKKAVASDAKVVRKKSYDPWGVKKLSVNSKEYLNKKQEEIPADERYLHRFATLKFTPKTEEAVTNNEFDEVESVNSDEFEQLMERFEPGEKNEEFDIDFSKEFSSEKKRKEQGKKRKAEESDGEDDDMLDEEDWEDDDEDHDSDAEIAPRKKKTAHDEDEESEEDMEDDGEDDEDDEGWGDDVEDDEDDDEDDEDEDGFFGGGKGGKGGKKNEMGDSDDDEDYGDADAFVSADKFAEMLEENGLEDTKETLKRKIRKPKGFRKRGKN